MSRLTEKTADGAVVLADGVDVSAAVTKLAQLEDMYDALLTELKKVTDDIEREKARGKTNSVTHRQLIAGKLMCMNLLSRFETYLGDL
jgi:hypothetical protein